MDKFPPLRKYVLLESQYRSVRLLNQLNSISPNAAQLVASTLLARLPPLPGGAVAVLLREDGEAWFQARDSWVDMEPDDMPAPWLVNPYLNRAMKESEQ